MGLGFNIKTLLAFLALPAFYLLYLLAARTGWWRRFVHLGLATLVVVVSLSWAIAVDLTPSDQRPYVGGSSDNSALDLAFGYNGLERLLGHYIGQGGGPPGGSGGPPGVGPGGGSGPGGVGENGELDL